MVDRQSFYLVFSAYDAWLGMLLAEAPSGRELSPQATEGAGVHDIDNLPKFRAVFFKAPRAPSVSASPSHLPPGGRLIRDAANDVFYPDPRFPQRSA